MLWTIDRIENGIAIIDAPNGEIKLPLAALPEGAREGAVILLELSDDEEEKTRKRIRGKMNNLFFD